MEAHINKYASYFGNEDETVKNKLFIYFNSGMRFKKEKRAEGEVSERAKRANVVSEANNAENLLFPHVNQTFNPPSSLFFNSTIYRTSKKNIKKILYARVYQKIT